MNLITQKPRAVLSFRHFARSPMGPLQQDHDLPILAQEENPRVILDWDALLRAGVQPALVLGAERRWQGRR